VNNAVASGKQVVLSIDEARDVIREAEQMHGGNSDLSDLNHRLENRNRQVVELKMQLRGMQAERDERSVEKTDKVAELLK
jgi:hypothetical protein